MTFKDEASYYSFAAGWGTVRRLPEKSAYNNFRRIADRLWKKQGGGVRQLEHNLRRVLPGASDSEIREVSRDGMRNYFRYWCDAFRMPDWSNERIVNTFKARDDHHLSDALALGKGLVIALPHMGNWDHAGAWASLDYSPVTAIAERLKPEKLFQRFVDYRASVGLRIYPVGTPDVMEILAHDALEENRIIALVSDRDLSARGVDVEFFGDTTRMPGGAASLAMRTGSPLLSATLWYDGPNAAAKIYPQIAVPSHIEVGENAAKSEGYLDAVQAMTQQLANNFEAGIREHPADWHMLQKVWLSDLDQDRLAASDAAAGRTPGGAA